MMRVDLNCDLGEGGAHDAAVMPLITSANIACGGHAGDEATMRATVALARQYGVAIGAHPGFIDRANFGRIERPVDANEVATLVVAQVENLISVAGEVPRHVKLHGALYNQVCRSLELSRGLARVNAARWPSMRVVALAGSTFVGAARAEGLAVDEEAFIDRSYEADGTLTPRGITGSVLHDVNAAAARAVTMVKGGRVEVRTGGERRLRVDTLCLHGDGDDPAGWARVVVASLREAGIAIAAPSAPSR
jgi:UPF0271 protein